MISICWMSPSGTSLPRGFCTSHETAWLKAVADFQLKPYPVEKYAARLAPKPAGETLPSLADIGFEPTNLGALNLPTGMSGGRRLFEDFAARIERYKRARDFPADKRIPTSRATGSIRRWRNSSWRKAPKAPPALSPTRRKA